MSKKHIFIIYEPYDDFEIEQTTDKIKEWLRENQAKQYVTVEIIDNDQQ